MKKSFLKIILISLLIGQFFTAFAQKFTINGTALGIKDSTLIFLRKASPDIKIDSSLVLNGKFVLKGNVNEKAAEMIIHTVNYINYTSLWIEPTDINITLKSGEFKKAIISGSKTQVEAESLRSKLTEVNQLQDSLKSLLKGKKGVETIAVWDNLRAAQAKEQSIYQGYITSNPNSIISANILYIYSSSWGKEKTKELYQNLTEEQKLTKFGKGVNDYLILNKEIKLGNKFEDFEQANTIGKKIKLSDIKAKYILLEFWGSWCGPCRAENPNLVKTYNEYKSKGFEVLGIAADDNKEQWLKAIIDDKLPWENVSDLKGDRNEAVVIYGVYAFPTNYLIDDKGIIIAKNLRGETLRKKLAELLP